MAHPSSIPLPLTFRVDRLKGGKSLREKNPTLTKHQARTRGIGLRIQKLRHRHDEVQCARTGKLASSGVGGLATRPLAAGTRGTAPVDFGRTPYMRKRFGVAALALVRCGEIVWVMDS